MINKSKLIVKDLCERKETIEDRTKSSACGPRRQAGRRLALRLHVQVVDNVSDAVDLPCYLRRLLRCGDALPETSAFTVHLLIAGAVIVATLLQVSCHPAELG
jgi:predicted ester cyclase